MPPVTDYSRRYLDGHKHTTRPGLPWICLSSVGGQWAGRGVLLAFVRSLCMALYNNNVLFQLPFLLLRRMLSSQPLADKTIQKSTDQKRVYDGRR